MNTNLQTASLPERIEHLFNLISSKRFLRTEGLGKEVPFFICPFNPAEALDMQKLEKQLIKRLPQHGVRVLLVNLYDLVHDIMQRDGDWDWHIEQEATKAKDDLRSDLQGILDIENAIVPEIENRMNASEWDVLFITGIGEVFPYIRSHNVLNNLQKVAKERPTVMFFPGEYTHSDQKGTSLDLFGRLSDDKYYRAFNIYDC